MSTRRNKTGPVDNPYAIRASVRTALYDVEGCLHPDAPKGCDGIIDAHSVQRRGPLSHLKDETNHVYTFSPMSNARFPTDPDPIGWHKASTFRGLCGSHDKIFRSIEDVPFSGTEEQIFLVGYRAIFLECHQKRAAIAAVEKVGYTQMANMHAEEQEFTEARRGARVRQAGRRKGSAEINETKAIYDRAWALRDYGDIASCIIEFDGNLSVASAGMVSPDYAVDGERLQELHLPGMQSLAFGTVATSSGGSVVFTWPRTMSAMARFVESLVRIPSSDLPGALLLFTFSYVSNTFFQLAWWNSLRSTARVRLAEAGRKPQQYYAPVNYRIGPVVDWKITRVG